MITKVDDEQSNVQITQKIHEIKLGQILIISKGSDKKPPIMNHQEFPVCSVGHPFSIYLEAIDDESGIESVFLHYKTKDWMK